MSERTVIAAEPFRAGDAIVIGADGRAYLADRAEAARRAAEALEPADLLPEGLIVPALATAPEPR